METAYELSLVAVLNMRTVDWDTPFPAVKYSNDLTIISLILLGVLAPFLTVLYCKKFAVLSQTNFRSKCGAGLEGTKVDVSRP